MRTQIKNKLLRDTRELAIEKVADFVAEFAVIDQVMILKSPVESQIDDLIPALREQLSLSLPKQSFPSIHYAPILACHLGPEALGIIVYEGI